MSTKLCTKCGSPGPFYRNKHMSDGLSYWCKQCASEYSQRRRAGLTGKRKPRPEVPTCPRCGSLGPFYRNKHSATGFEYICKECSMKDKQRYRIEGPKTKPLGPKVCTMCGSVGPFGKRSNNWDGLDSLCVDCRKTKTHDTYLRNKDTILTNNKAWRQRNSLSLKEFAHQQYVKNREQIREYNQQYYVANYHKFRESAHRRRARKMAAEGSFTEAQFSKLKKLFDNRCLCCGRQEPEIQLQADHVVPLARGGSNDISNIQPLCRSCNSSKRANTVDYRPSDRQPLISVAST